MGFADLIFNGLLVVLGALLALSAVSSWIRTRRTRYLVISALCGLTAIGWGLAILSRAAPLEQWLGTMVFLLVCALVIRSSQRADAAAGQARPAEGGSDGRGPEAT